MAKVSTDRIYSAHTLGVSKPDPGLFLAAVQAFGLKPEDCLVVEDSPTGSLAAKRAGLRCLGYAPHGDGAQLRANGAYIIDDMTKVSDLIGI